MCVRYIVGVVAGVVAAIGPERSRCHRYGRLYLRGRW